jgi:DNA topoisomerase-1
VDFALSRASSLCVARQKRVIAHVDPYQAAALAGLHYASPEGVGVKRVRSGRGFKYVDSEGQAVAERAFLRRVRSLVIPPAWASVWISADPNGHIQAVGWDAKGRKQYRYHPLYREVRDHAKFDRLIEFGRVLPKIRAAVSTDLAVKGLPQRKVVAVVVRLLEETCIRVGNEEYERLNGSFGLTTMKSRHVTIEGSELRFRFKGKSGQTHDILMKDTRLARIVRACQCIPGYELFQYKDETGEVHSVNSEDVNTYLSETSGGSFTAKDFRTWAGTCTAANFLRQREPVTTQTDFKRVTAEVVKLTAEKLGNRAATCRKYYIHPMVFTAFENGTLFKAFEKYPNENQTPEGELKPEEQAVLHMLENAPALLTQIVKIKPRRKVRTVTRTRVTVRVSKQPAELAS